MHKFDYKVRNPEGRREGGRNQRGEREREERTKGKKEGRNNDTSIFCSIIEALENH